jgi:hypothetical protein
MTKARSNAGRVRLAAGDLVAVPLENGRFAMIWIIETDLDRNINFLVMDGFWDVLPGARTVAAARASKSSSPDLASDDVWKGWFRGAVPSDFTVIGQRAPSKKEIGYVTNGSGTMIFGTAKRLCDELHRTWRLKHDRRAIEAEWAAAATAREQRVSDRRKAMTLQTLLREPLFGRTATRVVREAQRIFRDATNDLIKLEGATKRERTKVLKRITTELNALDDKTGFIETVEREKIVARIEELAALVGISNQDEKLTGHREW